MGKGRRAAGVPQDETAATTQPFVDPAELAKFRELGRRWWDSDGPMRPLHRLNPLRIDETLAQACQLLGLRREGRKPLAGIRLLDVGCGGGLLAEPLCRLGATVTAIDPEPANVEAARWHRDEAGLEINYRATTLEKVAAGGERFDLVTALEVIEHVPEPQAFAQSLARCVRPGGAVMLSTLSRTTASWLLGIVAAERLLRWLPVGTHDWQRFVKPSELAGMLRTAGLRPAQVTGIRWDPAHDRFETSRAVEVNYMMSAVRDR